MIRRRYNCVGFKIPLLGRSQLEVWFCPPRAVIPLHVHPNVDSRLMFLGGRMVWHLQVGPYLEAGIMGWRQLFRAFDVPAGCPHGATVIGPFGIFANLERWRKGVAKKSVADDLVETR